MSSEQSAQKDWNNATIKDNFIFGKTMELFPDLCRQLIEKILKIKIRSIKYPEREKVIEQRTDSKGIRIDVYVEDNQQRSFDLEMQVADNDNIAKRMRYYQGLIDLDKLKRGQHYSALGASYIIFICPFDRFKQGRHIYSFCERCDQDNTLSLNDGSVKIFLSTKGTLDDVSPDVKAFLNYVDSGIIKGKFVQQLDVAVQKVKSNQKARLEYMTYQMALLESKLEGEQQGREEGINSVAVNMLREGLPCDQIQKFTNLTLDKIQELAKKLH